MPRKSVNSARAAASEPIAKIQVGAAGRVVIPAELRARLGIQEGEVLSARIVEGELRLLPRAAAVAKARRLVRKAVPAGVSLVDALIAERRAEARADSET